MTLVGLLIIPTGTRFAALARAELGGLSGCAYDRARGDVLAVSDDRDDPRIFTLRVRGSDTGDGGLQVEPMSSVGVRPGDGRSGPPAVLDFEGITLVAAGEMVISSEGQDSDSPDAPPALLRLDREGNFLGALPVPSPFLGGTPGGPPGGMRGNQAFESLAGTPDGTRLFTGAEGPLLQDDEEPTFERGARTRLLELTKAGDGWTPARQLVYELEPVRRPPWSGRSSLSSGLVELVALDTGTLLAMERSFVSERDGARRSFNDVAIFEVDLSDADDVSSVWSLRDRPGARPVVKRPVLILDALRSTLPVALQTLENFEAMCEGPSLPDGGRSLLLISDNNFRRDQTTAFLLFRMELR